MGRPSEVIVGIEPFVFLGIILLVWFLSSLGSWLRQELERRSPSPWEPGSPRDPAAPVEYAPAHMHGSGTAEEATHGAQEETSAASRSVAAEQWPRPVSGRSRYRSPQAVRQGIVMMTVFGACTALDPRKARWLKDE